MQKARTGIMMLRLLLLLACSCCAFALDQRLDISQYAHTSWKVRDGFIKGATIALAQTPDGYLWLGTDLGLYRFDGVRIVPWQPASGEQLPSSFITALLVGRDGTLWIGTLKGLMNWHDGRLTSYPAFAGTAIYALAQGHEDTLWIGTFSYQKGSLCSLKAGAVHCYEEESFGLGVTAIYEDRKRNLWVVAAETGVWRWAPGPREHYKYPLAQREVLCIAEDESGTIVIGGPGGLQQIRGRALQKYPLPGITGPIRAFRLLQTHDGSLWAGTSVGLLHIHGGRVDQFRAIDGLSGESVSAIFEDREGNVWAGTQDGFDRFREFRIVTTSQAQGLSDSAPWSIQATADGSIWLAAPKGLNRLQGSHVTVYGTRAANGKSQPGDDRNRAKAGPAGAISNTVFTGFISSLGQDNRGRLWVSDSDGIFFFEGEHFTRVRGLPGGLTISIAGDADGNMWISNTKLGLFHWTPDGASQTPWSHFGEKRAVAVLPDSHGGGVWLGFYEGGIAYFKNGEVVTSFSSDQGLGGGRVSHIRSGPRGALWAATQGGLSRIQDGHIATLTSKNGLPCDEVYWSMEDADHDNWLYMPCGLARIARSELDQWVNDPKHKVQASLFDASDGVRMRGIPGGFGPQATESADGRIWFLPNDGVSVIDPHHVAFNQLPPPVHIEQITADDKKYDPANGLRLPPRIRNLDIDYTALSLVVPEKVRFRVKLEGQDNDWRELVNVRHVEYTNLPPKHYKFRVMASNNSGVWNEEGAALEFVIPPMWYQTNWFRALCVAVFLAMIWGVYQLRVRQLAAQFNMRMEERVHERTRIARDLHDTLLQSFHGLLMNLQTASRLLPGRPLEAKERLDGTIDQVEEAIVESRDAVQGLRASTVQSNDLARAISTLGEELAADSTHLPAPAFRVTVEGASRELHPILRDEIYRIAAEALRNAFRHAQARQIEVEVRYDRQQFSLHVRDDGHGFDPAVSTSEGRKGHYGLPGMRERATLAGGRLTVWSQVGAGTEVELTIPAGIAYAASSRRSGKMAGKLRAQEASKDPRQ